MAVPTRIITTDSCETMTSGSTETRLPKS